MPNTTARLGGIVAGVIAIATMSARAVTFNMLSCCPGEDNATQARFVWHSDSNACTLWYAKASAPGSAVQATCESVYKPVSFRSSDVNYYKYTAALSSLDPGTEYIYWVEAGGSRSGVQRFKTAGTSGSYNFLWLSDVHSHPDDSEKTNSVNTIVANAKSAAGSLDFILFSGDMVKYGARYDNWQQWNGNVSFTDYMHALCPGNKEYYYNGSQTGINGTSNRIHNKWLLACRNNPQNGADGIESSYWFIRDGVMFVAMDTLADEGVDMDTYVYNNAFALQTNWFDRVVSEQESKKSFRYLVVFQHYPHFTYAEGDGFKYGSGRYKKWKDLFDKHKVDFALTGDHHNYSRSKKLRGGSENSEGTVYITAPEIGTSLYLPSVKAVDKLNSYNVTSGDNPTVKTLMATAHNGDEAVGGVWFSVTPEKMKMHYIGTSTSPYDTVEVTPKDRGFVYDPSGGTTGGDATPHARYRFAVDAPRSDTWCMQLSEIQLMDENGNRISSGYTLAYDSTTKDSYGDTYPSNENPECATDGDISTKWLDWRAGLNQTAAVRSAAWLDFCFTNPTAVYGYRWYTANDAPSRTPVSWTFSASDDGGATWTVLDKVEAYNTTSENNALAYTKRIVEQPQPPVTLDEFTWKGGYDDDRISSASNWEEGVAPPANSAATLVFPFTSNTTVSSDYASLAVKKIVFPASTSRASFVGGPVTIAESVVNNASVTNEFKNAVTFSGLIDVTGEMDFPGGVTGTVPANHTTYRGNYNLTTTGSWTPASGSRVPSGSTLSMPNGTFYCHVNSLSIERNATVTASAAKMDRTDTAYLLGENDGIFKTTGVLTSSGNVSGTKYHYFLHTGVENSSEGLIALGGIRIKGAPVVYANSYGGTYQMAVGDNGIKKDAGAAGYFLIRNDNKPEYIGSWCNGNDYKIAVVDGNGSYPTSTSEYVLYGSRTDRTYNINFDTTDCFNAGVRNTVRDMSPICGAAPANVSVGIYGGGTFTFENMAVNAPGLYSGGTVVSNSATVAILAGSCPGRGDLALRDTATLSIPDSASGTANVFGTLTVNAGTRIAFAGLAAGTTPLSVGGLVVGTGTEKPIISVNASGLGAGTYPLFVSSSATAATEESFTLSTSGASDKALALVKSGNDICLAVLSGVHGKWLGGNDGNRFSVAANWDDGEVPAAGDALDFSSVTSATTIDADINATFGAVTMGTGVVTFTGSLTATSFSDTSKIAVGANATVTLVGDLVFANATEGKNDYIVNAIAAGGAFVVTGDIVSSANGKGYVVPTINGGDGVIVAKGLVQNSSCSDNPSFRLVRDAAGTVRWVIGVDGISGTKNYWLLNNAGKPTAIVKADDSDFTVSAKIGNRQVATLRFDTTGRDGLGHTISLTGGIYREGKVFVEGTGTVSCGYVQSDSSNPFTVTDTATLALLSGSNIGTGGVTVNSGASLALSGAGTATLGGTLTLQGGSRLVVGAAGAQGYSRLAAKSVSLAGNITVEIPSQTVGTFTVLTRTDGSFTNSDLAKLSLSVVSPDTSLASSLVLADSGKSIVVSTVAAWPANWNGGHAANAAMQTAFAAWAATPGNDATAARAEGAFLLGLDLADYTEDMKIVGMALQGNKFTIDTNVDLTKVRGRLYVLVADSPADIEKSGTKITGTVADLSKLIGIDASAPAKFFKVGIDYAVGGN